MELQVFGLRTNQSHIKHFKVQVLRLQVRGCDISQQVDPTRERYGPISCGLVNNIADLTEDRGECTAQDKSLPGTALEVSNGPRRVFPRSGSRE